MILAAVILRIICRLAWLFVLAVLWPLLLSLLEFSPVPLFHLFECFTGIFFFLLCFFLFLLLLPLVSLLPLLIVRLIFLLLLLGSVSPLLLLSLSFAILLIPISKVILKGVFSLVIPLARWLRIVVSVCFLLLIRPLLLLTGSLPRIVPPRVSFSLAGAAVIVLLVPPLSKILPILVLLPVALGRPSALGWSVSWSVLPRRRRSLLACVPRAPSLAPRGPLSPPSATATAISRLWGRMDAARCVVVLPLEGVREHLVGFADFLEFFSGLPLGFVRMILLSHLIIALFYFNGCGRLGHAQRLVVVLWHVKFRYKSARIAAEKVVVLVFSLKNQSSIRISLVHARGLGK